MKSKHFLAFSAFAFIVATALSLLLPGFVLGLLNNPDGSYLSALLLKHQMKNPILHTSEFYTEYVPAVVRRLILSTFLLVGAIQLLATRFRSQVIEFWNHQSSALNLGILRVVVVSQSMMTDFSPIFSLPQMGPDALNIPPGYGWIKHLMPPSAAFVDGSMFAFKWLLILALLGVLTRLTIPLLIAVSFWTMLGPNMVGKIIHYHHLWLGLVIISLSPCGDALSVDWLVQKIRGKAINPFATGIKYGRYFVYLWMIMGLAYFFPGFWKFVIGGMDWALSENVQLKILTKIVETGEQPLIPLYEYPILCKLGGLATIIWEATFIFAMIFPKWRALFALGGIGFHEINERVMQIGFPTMERFYLSFVNWSWIVQKIANGRLLTVAVFDKIPSWKNAVAGVTIGGLLFTGFLHIDSWPWAVYPTFAAIEQKFMNSIEMRILEDGKEPHLVLLQTDPTLIKVNSSRTKLRAFMNLVIQERSPEHRRAMLNELLTQWKSANSLPENAKLEFWHVMIPLLPLNSPPTPYKKLDEW